MCEKEADWYPVKFVEQRCNMAIPGIPNIAFTVYEEGKKRRKPNYSSVDLSEVEWEDRDDVKRVLVMTNDYYYTDIKGTPFRSYCNTDVHPEHRQMTQLKAIKNYLTGKEPLLPCEYISDHSDKELIQEVLFDAVVSAPIEAYWTSLALNKSENSDKGVEVAFLGTRTGFSRINLFVGPEQLTNQDFLTAEDKENIFNADHFPLWYRRAAEQIPGSFVYSIPFSTETANKSNVVTASTAIQLLDDRKSPVVAGKNKTSFI
ncbi:Voltage-dependent calcium channel subunit alpha-2/delta-3, partial [Ophiophagus hannah]